MQRRDPIGRLGWIQECGYDRRRMADPGGHEFCLVYDTPIPS